MELTRHFFSDIEEQLKLKFFAYHQNGANIILEYYDTVKDKSQQLGIEKI